MSHRRVATLSLATATALAVMQTVSAQPEQPINISQTAGSSQEPAVAVWGSQALIVWTEGEQIWYARRPAGVWLPAAPMPGALGSALALAADGDGNFHAAWSGYSVLDDNYEIYYSQMQAGRWSLPVIVSGTMADSVEPDVASRADGGLLLVWSEPGNDGTTIMAAGKPPNGSWSSGPVPEAEGSAPSVAAGDSAWYLAWSQVIEPGDPSQIVYARGDVTGWDLPEVVSSSYPAPSTAPSIAVPPALTWREGDSVIRFGQRQTGGWSPPETAASAAGGGIGDPALASIADGYAIAWAEQGSVNLQFEGVDGWRGPVSALTFALGARGAAMAAEGAGVLVVAEGRDATPAGEIYAVHVDPEDVATATPTTTGTPGAVDPTATATTTAPTEPRSPTPTTGTSIATTPPATVTGSATQPTPTGTASPSTPTASVTAGTGTSPAPTETPAWEHRVFLPMTLRTARLEPILAAADRQ